MQKIAILLVLLCSATPTLADAFSDAYSAYQQAYEQEQYEQAIPLLKTAITEAKSKFGENHINTLNLQYSLGNNLAQIKKHADAYSQYEAIAESYADKVGEESIEYYEFSLQRLLVSSYLMSSNGDGFRRKQMTRARQTLALAEDLIDESPQLESRLLYQFVKTLQDSRAGFLKLERNIDVTKRAYESLLSKLGEQDLRTLSIHFYLAKLYEAQKQYDNAIEIYERLVSIVGPATDFSHPYELGAHARLVYLYENKGQSDKATEHCLAIGEMTPWSDDIEPTPLYRKPPDFPISAARMGREGWARLSFDITPGGFVDNIKVLDVKGSDSFAKVSKEALASWRYAPKFVDGEPVKAENISVQMDFKVGR
ncbi:TonB family protein [Aestuariibacter salexigens]|uniref:TonB family protein n=1 Tax=Aestuariibacter salexigens TaxID=226010 RepID=UPI000426377F|nr:TonB family protein [Aestuariibacter salexigens]